MALRKIYRKSLLYRSGVEYADYSINHVEGCSHGCRYPCYAMMMKLRFGAIKDYQDWIRPKIVANALELLEREIPRYKPHIRSVHLCFSTDPFMYKQPEVQDLSLKILARFAQDDISCSVLTKGVYPAALKDKRTYGVDNEYGITLVSTDAQFKRVYEPGSASFERRIDALRELHASGLKTWISMEPYPTPNIVSQDLERLLRKVAFADKIVFGRLNYNTLASSFLNHRSFYNQCADTVTEFCKERGIDFHIKEGTRTKDARSPGRARRV